MRLIGIADPCPGLGEFGHALRRGLPPDAFEESFVDCRKKFFRSCHTVMLAQRTTSPITA
jgi:hypothetical protein